MLLLWMGDIKTEALGRSAGPVQNVIMALPQNKPWSAIREELKRCFSDQISLRPHCFSIRKPDSKAK